MTLEAYVPLLKGAIYLIGGYVIARFLSKGIRRVVQRQQRPRYSLLIEKAVFYVIFILFLISALRQWGFNLSVILGATGIISVALGLASQTVMSNLVSGIFLIGEDSLRIGDMIKVNDIEGKIISVNLFSIKLKREDNTLARIPNDLLLKNPVINLSHFKD